MIYYPIFLKVKNHKCLLVGAGDVGLRKLKSLLECDPAEVLVLDTSEPNAEIIKICQDKRVNFVKRAFTPEDLTDRFMVLACTSNKDVNKLISDLCKKQNILCNIADLPEKSSFILPSVIRQGDLTLAVSTGGCSPAFTKKVRRELQNVFGPHYAAFITLMGKIRPLVLDLGMETSHNTALFRELVASNILDELEAGNIDRVEELLTQILPDELLPCIPELINDLI
ncbi:precorrin-2 dehydrogenase/sirohydrochlorin ferrochelatase family protein [Maridesulfovibrio zosterae]|uniref:precorrin-2 dehydrogenase/sirohydrochlorin ferrochelatase family protein n=1 Tax=Maridesulfovibrio zosterae TaxID=82171 RepID=UPI0003F614E9|nr:bifunctional precorrin-2 dehydrogenase/sirohydrochlorin ferrochelatase [Maridesulfovibrio zosterae]